MATQTACRALSAAVRTPARAAEPTGCQRTPWGRLPSGSSLFCTMIPADSAQTAPSGFSSPVPGSCCSSRDRPVSGRSARLTVEAQAGSENTARPLGGKRGLTRRTQEHGEGLFGGGDNERRARAHRGDSVPAGSGFLRAVPRGARPSDKRLWGSLPATLARRHLHSGAVWGALTLRKMGVGLQWGSFVSQPQSPGRAQAWRRGVLTRPAWCQQGRRSLLCPDSARPGRQGAPPGGGTRRVRCGIS